MIAPTTYQLGEACSQILSLIDVREMHLGFHLQSFSDKLPTTIPSDPHL